jgi:hypothetical protein
VWNGREFEFLNARTRIQSRANNKVAPKFLSPSATLSQNNKQKVKMKPVSKRLAGKKI